MQEPEGRQQRLQLRPEAEPLQQAPAGVGEGIGAAAADQSLRGLGIVQADAPAGIGHGEGRERSGGSGAMDAHPQRGSVSSGRSDQGRQGQTRGTPQQSLLRRSWS